MRRIARILGVIGGIGAVLWAMRDRLVSVAIPREPQLPTFRVPDRAPGVPPGEPSTDEDDTSPEEATPADEDDDPAPTLTDISGIGPVYATRLAAAGVNTIEDLARSEVDRVAEAAEVPSARASKWVESARSRVDAAGNG